VDDETMRRAAYVAGVDEFAERSADGYDTQVGERGMNLSGGQRQAVAIARALLLDPPVLVFDEPTSHMDNSSELRFRERLSGAMGEKTVIISTHRSSLLALVSRIVVLDGGQVVADGPKETVLEALRQGRLKAS
jgi:ATP-binding cassette subfamily C protein LapB